MSAGFKHTAARVITSNRHMAVTAMKGLTSADSGQASHVYTIIHQVYLTT